MANISTRPDAYRFLTGQLSNNGRPSGIIEQGGIGKFDVNGESKNYPGNTFICLLNQSSRSYKAITEIQQHVRTSKFGSYFVFLPPSSLHMTVFDGISAGSTEQSNILMQSSNISERDTSTDLILTKLSGIQIDTPKTVTAKELYCANSLTITEPNDESSSKLNKARQLLQSATGIYSRNYDNYVFHITLGYLLQWLEPSIAHLLINYSDNLYSLYSDELTHIDINKCCFCTFENMENYKKVLEF